MLDGLLIQLEAIFITDEFCGTRIGEGKGGGVSMQVGGQCRKRRNGECATVSLT